MASKQTRRSISVSGETYDRLKAYCEQHGRSMSGVCEAETIKFLDLQPRVEKPARPVASPVQKTISLDPVMLTREAKLAAKEELPPSRVETIREAVEAKKPVSPLAAIDAASKIFTF
jgi:hypothetical protein